MKKIKINNQKYQIDCENEFCGNCSYASQSGDQKCKLFNVILDHIVDKSGLKRCEECIKAED